MADQVTPANALGRTDRSVESWEVPIGGTGGSDLPAERDGGGELPVRVQRCDNQEKLCDPFLNRFFGMINHENISCVLEDQKQMLTSLELANEKLNSLNAISKRRYFDMSNDLRRSTQTLVSMKRQLDSVFRRIRSLRIQLATQYPKEYSQVEAKKRLSDDEEEEG